MCSIQKYLLENKDSIDLNLTSKVSKQNFKYIFWRYPVSLKTNENLLVNNEKKIKIIGFQHGAHYLTKKNYYHFDQDFNNCNYWISYNSSQADYKKIYGVKKKRCKIIKQSFLHKKKEVSGTKLLKNQILYPLRQINHLYESGIEDKIVMKKQIEILKILEGFKKNYMIKPLFPINRKNCALIDIFKKLKYGKILSGISLKNYLKLFEHKIIVLDNYETTLYDAIEYSNNSKIIIIDDENDFGYKLNKNFKIKVPSRVIFLKKISNLKDILKKKIKTKKKHILKNNFAFNNYNIINKIIN